MRLTSAISVLAFVLSASAALAHDYDPNKVVTLNGEVKEIKWDKPYVKIHLSVKETSGKTKDWELETAMPSVLESDGLVRTSIKKGDRITVQGEQASNGSEHALVRSMTLADGRIVSIRGAETASAAAPQTSAANQQAASRDSSQDVSSPALPKTASNMPLIGLMGLVALGAGTFLSLLRARASK
jgi:LPXTG-motif cell wall-anchored protein